MWSVEHPAVLLLLLVVPFAVYAWHFWHGRGGKIRFPFHVYGSRGFRPSFGVLHGARATGSVLFWSGFILLILAASGPIQIQNDRVFLGRGIDILIVLDESPTMAASDFGGQTRFDGARSTVESFVRARPGDAIGLVSFSLSAALRMPLTTDHDMLIDRLQQLQIMDLGDGTAIGDALGVAALHLRYSDAPSRVIVFISDGVHNAGLVEPDEAADIAESLGIRIYTIGVGTQAETTLDFVEPATGNRYQAVIDSGFDETLLRDLARRTGGVYYHARSERGLSQILDTINSLETTDRRTRISVRIRRLDRQVLMLAALLFGVSYIIRSLIFREVL